MNLSTAMNYRQKIEKAALSLSDEEARIAPEMFPHWQPSVTVTLDERICYENKLYRVVQAHTTQEGWEPNITPALFTEIAKPGEIPVWRQPTGAQDAYMTGDKVYYPTINDTVYISIVDNNVWEPTVYGWEVSE